jgi:hypothetical protein
MADIVAITQTINYEVNTAGLEKATALIHAQLAELQALNGAIVNLQKQLAGTGDKQSEQFAKVSKQLDETTGKYEKLAAKIKGGITINGDYSSGSYHGSVRLSTDCRPYANIYTHQKGRAYLILDGKPPFFLMAKQ